MVDIITRLWNPFCHVYAVDPVLESDQNYRIGAHVFLRHSTHRFSEFGSIGVPKGSVRGRYPEMDIGRLTAVCTENSVYKRRGNEFHSNLHYPRYQVQSILCPQSYDDSALTIGQGPSVEGYVYQVRWNLTGHQGTTQYHTTQGCYCPDLFGSFSITPTLDWNH